MPIATLLARGAIPGQVSEWKVADLGSPSTWQEDKCALCHLFKTLHRNKLSETNDNTPYTLVTVGSRIRDIVYGLGVTATQTVRDMDDEQTIRDVNKDCAASGYITPVTYRDSLKGYIGRHVGVDRLTEMIDMAHIRRIVARHASPWRKWGLNWAGNLPLDQIPRFKLIDCNTAASTSCTALLSKTTSTSP